MGLALPIYPLKLHDARDQYHLKQSAWWVTEELIEAQWGMWEGNLDKTIEELADALHFQVEMCIITGIKPVFKKSLPRNWGQVTAPFNTPAVFRRAIMGILEELGMGMWQLRNKAWKQTQVLTDTDAFQACMVRAMWGILEIMSLPPYNGLVDAVTTYLRKSEVNLWRIKTQY